MPACAVDGVEEEDEQEAVTAQMLHRKGEHGDLHVASLAGFRTLGRPGPVRWVLCRKAKLQMLGASSVKQHLVRLYLGSLLPVCSACANPPHLAGCHVADGRQVLIHISHRANPEFRDIFETPSCPSVADCDWCMGRENAVAVQIELT